MVGFGSSSAKKVAKRVVVGVGDVTISSERGAILSTFALGSCVGMVLFDSKNGVGGLLHFMLPFSAVAAEKSRKQPFLFADTGIQKFISMFTSMGGDLSKTKCVIAGGASVMTSSDTFKIGEKNGEAAKTVLRKMGIPVLLEQLGGFSNRSLHLDLSDGSLVIALPTEKKEVSLA